MARARNIKPGFFKNDVLSECSPLARLLFIGMWTLADREGRLENRPMRIKVEALPYDDCDVSELIQQLIVRGFVMPYEVNGKGYFQIVNWTKHQNPHHKEVPSDYPPPTGWRNSIADDYVPLNNPIRAAIFERDGRECAYCGAIDELHIDHILPISRGGNSEPDNLQVLCSTCNTQKSNKIIDQSLSKIHGRPVHDSSMNQGQVKEIASCPTDSPFLIPDSPLLIPDSLHSFAPIGAQSRFDEFWNAYPVKNGKKKAAEYWKKRQSFFDGLADMLLADIAARIKSDRQWVEGFIPWPQKYLGQELWTNQMAPPVASKKSINRPVTDSEWLQFAADHGIRTKGKTYNQIWSEVLNKQGAAA